MVERVRNAPMVLSKLKTIDDQIVCTENCRIQIPSRYAEVNLAQLGTDTFILGVYAILLDNNMYAVSNILGLIKIIPDKVQKVVIDDVEYLEFVFEAGSTVIDNINIVRRDTILYDIFNEFIFMGNVPWYMNYNDLGKLFDTTLKFADSHAGEMYEVNEFLASIIARSPKDRSVFYRLDLPNKLPPQYVALTSIYYSINNPVNKIAGSYFTDGLISALVNPSNEVGHIEKLLRT